MYSIGDLVHYRHNDKYVNGRVTEVFESSLRAVFMKDFIPFDEKENITSGKSSWYFTRNGEFVSREEYGQVLFKGHYTEPSNEFYRNQRIILVSKSGSARGFVKHVHNDEYLSVFLDTATAMDGYNLRHTWDYDTKSQRIIHKARRVGSSDFKLLDEKEYDKSVLKAMERTPEEKILVRTGNDFLDAMTYMPELKGELTEYKPSTIKKENEMANLRKTVKIELFDNDPALDVSKSLVASFDNVVTEDSASVTIQELMMNEDIAGKLKAHNEMRVKQKDLAVIKATGNKVNLEPVKLKNLTWMIDGIQAIV